VVSDVIWIKKHWCHLSEGLESNFDVVEINMEVYIDDVVNLVDIDQLWPIWNKRYKK